MVLVSKFAEGCWGEQTMHLLLSHQRLCEGADAQETLKQETETAETESSLVLPLTSTRGAQWAAHNRCDDGPESAVDLRGGGGLSH